MTRVQPTLDSLIENSKQPIVVHGPQILKGCIEVQSSKNAVNRLLVASVAVPGVYVFRRFPFILDPLRVAAILEFLGAKITVDEEARTISLDTRSVENRPIPYELTKTTTGAFGLAGALLGRFGSVTIGKPGGDKIGPRPVNLHIDALRSLGAEVEEYEDHIVATLISRPNETYRMAVQSIGAAVNYVLAAINASSQVTLENAPEDFDMEALYGLLRQMGVSIELEENTLVVAPTDKRGVRITYDCPPDRNVAMTWVAYGAVSDGIKLTNVPLASIEVGLRQYEAIGTRIERIDNETIRVVRGHIPENSVTVVAGYNDMFHSDWLASFQAALCVLGVRATTIDTLFSQRVRQAEILHDMGALVTIHGGQPPTGVQLVWHDDPETARYIVEIGEKQSLHGANVAVGDDVRCTAAILLAALCAEGRSTLSDMAALYRGYENNEVNLRALGVTLG